MSIPRLQLSFRVDDAVCIYAQEVADNRTFGERVLRYIRKHVPNAPCELVSLYTEEYKSPKFHILPGTYSVSYTLPPDSGEHKERHMSVKIEREQDTMYETAKWRYTIEMIPDKPWTESEVETLLKHIKDSEPPASLSTLVYTSQGWEPIGFAALRTRETTFYDPGIVDSALVDVQKFLNSTPLYQKWKPSRSYTLLLQGPPGTGKTTFAELLASLLGYQIAVMQFDDKLSDRNLFQMVNELPRKTILLIEDIDCTFVERKAKDSLRTGVSFSGLLNMLDGVTSKPDQIMIMTTNHITELDPALVRAGRVNHTVKFESATEVQVRAMFKAMIPTQSVERFWQKAKQCTFTTATLYSWILKHLETSNIMEYWEQFKASLKDQTKPAPMSTSVQSLYS